MSECTVYWNFVDVRFFVARLGSGVDHDVMKRKY